MPSAMNTSPLLNHAVKVRAKNVELRNKITQVRHDVELIEKDVSALKAVHDDLVEQCRRLRDKQTDANQNLALEECRKQFHSYIHDIEGYLANKQWNAAAPLPLPVTATVESNLQEDLNQQLASVENWLMESAVTDLDKPSSIILEQQKQQDNDSEDLYKDLIFPSLPEDILTLAEDDPSDENHHHRRNESIKAVSPDDVRVTRPDKNQRRFALMRQLAEKSNKAVTRKLL